jgi:hypothetical protein
MKSILTRTLSPSFAVSVLALAVALGGGAAYATSRAAAAPNASLTCVVIKPSQFQNGWHNIPSADGFRSARACKDSLGFVHLDGVLTGVTGGTNAFRLPKAYRPAFNKAFAVAAGLGGPALEDVDVFASPTGLAGEVFMNGTVTNAVSLNGVVYKAGG